MQLVVHLPGAHDDAADVRGFGSLAGAGDGVGLDGVVAHVAVADDGVEPVDKKAPSVSLLIAHVYLVRKKIKINSPAPGAEISQRRRARPVVEEVLGGEHDEGLDVR